MSFTPREGIAVFGGTFDPVHRGHVDAARAARAMLGFDDFRMLPAGDPPHRATTGASAGQRLAMLELALIDAPELSIDRRELDRPGPSYMVDTLAELRREAPDHALFLVLGQDAANHLDQWHEWRRLPELAHLVIVTRPGRPADYAPELERVLLARSCDDAQRMRRYRAGRVITLPVAETDISSTQLRALLRRSGDVARWLHPAVLDYIREHGLYGFNPARL